MIDAATFASAGYAIEGAVFTHAECETLLESLSVISVQRRRAGIRHLMQLPEVAALASADALLAMTQRILGERAVPFRATLFEKSARANWLVAWHQDRALPIAVPFKSTEWGPWSRKEGITYSHAPAWALSKVVALRVHLDASNADNGLCR